MFFGLWIIQNGYPNPVEYCNTARFKILSNKKSFINIRADSRLAPSQWEMLLQSNAVSHWLGANLESALTISVVHSSWLLHSINHDDVIKWKHFPCYWPFVRGIHRSPVNSLHKGQWRRALMFSLICVWINGWVNNREAGDLRRYRVHYDVIVVINFPECSGVIMGFVGTHKNDAIYWTQHCFAFEKIV